VSLLEYRQRKSQKSGDNCNVGDEVQGFMVTTPLKNDVFPVTSDSSAGDVSNVNHSLTFLSVSV